MADHTKVEEFTFMTPTTHVPVPVWPLDGCISLNPDGKKEEANGVPAGTHKRTYRIRSKVHSELGLHIIVPTAYTSTIFK